ncbi:DUF1517 domain-containing protein [Phormidesmis sp. 146-35]
MNQKVSPLIKKLLKPLIAIALILTIALGHADGALAARSGGRIGGGSFRAPSRTYAPPSRTYAPPVGGGYGGGYYPGGGGFGLPFVYLPFLGGGGGGLFSLLIFFAIASFLVRSFRQNREDADELNYTNPAVSIARVQVGLLSEARNLQTDLDRIAQKANTDSSEGLAQVLQETTLSLLRHPEYWAYGGEESQQLRLEAAENQFNRLALSERSKFTAETLSNVNNQLKQSSALTVAEKGALAEQDPGEYIVVTLLVATQGKLELPKINSSEDLRKALSQLGSVSSDRLMALEVLWAPQAEGDVLTRDDLLTEYPDLKMV